jgi:nicotinamide riboside transporter PnuC
VPELLRAYGDLIRQKGDTVSVVLAALVGIVLLELATFVIGFVIQSVARAWRRSRDRRYRRQAHAMPSSSRHASA